ncbi:hypothetical protein GCM10017774_12910 [Lentzea cavernae]|uniref:Uncharacterized protein n=1 Tax=Lentzea cavernae TaxID=2020703 RepID=A0ABQ3M3I1_9PSEU|nr:hypothetical protein GCM10017774_12910 [Lentzea cavernae]
MADVADALVVVDVPDEQALVHVDLVAASPTPLATYIVANMSSIRLESSSEPKACTGAHGRCKISSPATVMHLTDPRSPSGVISG